MRRSVAVLLPVVLLATPATAAASHKQTPPPVVLETRHGAQRAVQESYCVSAPPHDGSDYGVSVCGDTPDLPPRRLAVVQPRERVAIVFRGATSITNAKLAVRRLGRKRIVYSLRLTGPRTRWSVRLPRGAYELEVFARFTMADGRAGDTSATLGLRVEPRRRGGAGPELAGRVA